MTRPRQVVVDVDGESYAALRIQEDLLRIGGDVPLQRRQSLHVDGGPALVQEARTYQERTPRGTGPVTIVQLLRS